MPAVKVPAHFPGFNGVSFVASPTPVTLRGRTSPVRRRLFADSDESEHEIEANRRHILEQQLAIIQREQTKKWNFDFDAGKPLEGRYDWQTLERPSHPLPPPAAMKRPAESDSPVPVSKRSRIQLSVRANLQTKITGKGL